MELLCVCTLAVCLAIFALTLTTGNLTVAEERSHAVALSPPHTSGWEPFAFAAPVPAETAPSNGCKSVKALAWAAVIVALTALAQIEKLRRERKQASLAFEARERSAEERAKASELQSHQAEARERAAQDRERSAEIRERIARQAEERAADEKAALLRAIAERAAVADRFAAAAQAAAAAQRAAAAERWIRVDGSNVEPDTMSAEDLAKLAVGNESNATGQSGHYQSPVLSAVLS